MNDTTLSPVTPLPVDETAQKARWPWLWGIFLKPRKTLAEVVSAGRGVWFPAILVLCLSAVLLAVANGAIRQRIGLDNPAQLPEYFQYYSQEQQQQFMNALQATSGTTFVFVLPAMAAIAKVVVGWLIVGSLVYLALTAVGSAVKAGTALNLVAWASMPFALRNLVRAGVVFGGGALIQAQGLSGFTPDGTGNALLFLNALLALVDLYWIGHVVLVNLGGRVAGKASATKTVTALTATLVIALILQALVGFGMAALASNVTALQVFM